MSSQSPFSQRQRGLFPTLPTGEAVATFQTYPDAQQAVDLLARADFPVNKVSIVGSDLKSVERVTGKLTWGRVALAGAASGAWLGLFFGLLLVIFSASPDFSFVLAALLIGAGFGMLFSVVSYAINRRRRDYTSVMQVIATSYSVIVDHSLVGKARTVLGDHAPGTVTPVVPVAARPPAHPEETPRYGANPTEPPRYGEKLPQPEEPAGPEEPAAAQEPAAGEEPTAPNEPEEPGDRPR